MKLRFGPAGNPESFYGKGNTDSWQMPEYLAEMGLNAYEYQCSRGNRISQEKAEKLGGEARKHDIALSIHAPYYINLSSKDSKAMENSKNYLLGSLQIAQWIGATKVVFHPGGAAKIARGEAMRNALEALAVILQEAEDRGFGGIWICPETMGKQNQLGTLDEVLQLCSLDSKRVKPTIDFGHLHALDGGCLNSKEDFIEVLTKVEKALGSQAVKEFHAHFSPIEFTKAGEKKHRNLADIGFGPEFKHLAEVIFDWNLTPTIICESAGQQDLDAQVFAKVYQSISLKS